ncbi:MAG: DUF4157 domain-containing protein [Rhodobacteraceae bacterium]|nr:DUF4157 domain-containing protein [Paracoccaceae bacterium]
MTDTASPDPGGKSAGGRTRHAVPAPKQAPPVPVLNLAAPPAAALAPGSVAMPDDLRARMESGFSASFADVRIFPDSVQARGVGARAFVAGSDIHVAPGQWRPEAPAGRALLAHELAHVLQQRTGRVRPTGETGGQKLNAEARLEHDAEAHAARALRNAGTQPPAAAGTYPAAPRIVAAACIQRSPEDPFHASLLDAYSRETGTPRDQAAVQSAGYTAWLTVSSLNRLSVSALLARLARMQLDGTLSQLRSDASPLLVRYYARAMTAIDVVYDTLGSGGSPASANATIDGSGLPAAEQDELRHFVRVPRIRSVDQRAGPGGATAEVPDAALAREIGFELDPSSRPPPAPPTPPTPPPSSGSSPPPPAPPPVTPPRTPWDGSTGATGAAAAQTAMKQELFAAYDAYLTHFRPTTVATLSRPRVPFTAPTGGSGSGPAATGVVDIANSARAELERRYATSMDAASSSPRQVEGRSARRATATAAGPQNIFDPLSAADRTTLTGATDLAEGVAWWLFQNDVPGAAGAAGSRTFASEILRSHHWSSQDPGATQFRTDVARDYAAASTLSPNNRQQLIEYRLTGWSERGGRGITLQSSFDPGTDPNRAELARRWQVFATAVHESLHLRAHPAFTNADQGRGTMREGFTEMFTVSTLNTDVLPRVRAGNAESLRRRVEGAQSPASVDTSLVPNHTTPTQYRAHRAQAERIRDGGTPPGGTAHAGVGEAAVRAAYFQGHVELIGLTPTGAQISNLPAAGAPRQIQIPGSITDLDDLANRSGVTRQTIMANNPGITDALPATAVLPGCREHLVVRGETRAGIARQNGVSESDLVRANPDIALDPATSSWPRLTQGHRLLIPVH